MYLTQYSVTRASIWNGANEAVFCYRSNTSLAQLCFTVSIITTKARRMSVLSWFQNNLSIKEGSPMDWAVSSFVHSAIFVWHRYSIHSNLCNQNIWWPKYSWCGLFANSCYCLQRFCDIYSIPWLLPVLSRSCWSTCIICLSVSIYLVVEQSIYTSETISFSNRVDALPIVTTLIQY